MAATDTIFILGDIKSDDPIHAEVIQYKGPEDAAKALERLLEALADVDTRQEQGEVEAFAEDDTLYVDVEIANVKVHFALRLCRERIEDNAKVEQHPTAEPEEGAQLP